MSADPSKPASSAPALAPLGWPLLRGKTAIITGGAGGIGGATAKLFADQGARVAVIDTAPTTEEFARALGNDHLGLVVNVADKAACEGACNQVARAFGRIDILVTMAGAVFPGKVADVAAADYDQMMDAHLRGTFNMCQATIARLRQQGSGVIVCMSSIAPQRGGGLRGGVHYAAAKGGILGLSRALARELAPENIRVNAVCPGAIYTGKRLSFADMNAQFAGDAIPMQRVGTSEEVARVFLFLASDMSTYITGATIDVNGGMHIH